mgnify:CR=1 FL=1
MARKRLIAGNWKMNGLAADGAALAHAVAQAAETLGPGAPELVLCPPATLLAQTVAICRSGRVGVGGQDCHTAASGAHTGDVAAPMLADLGCRFVIVGHSERRADHGEGDATVRAKASAAQAAGLVAIVCVGETLAERDAGQTLEVLRRQVAGSMPDRASAANTVVAYEPVWAIGTGRNATAAQIGEAHAFIRGELAGRVQDPADVRLLYGGSVKPANAAEILRVADVDGALVGGASLKSEDFLAIVRAAPLT